MKFKITISGLLALVLLAQIGSIPRVHALIPPPSVPTDPLGDLIPTATPDTGSSFLAPFINTKPPNASQGDIASVDCADWDQGMIWHYIDDPDSWIISSDLLEQQKKAKNAELRIVPGTKDVHACLRGTDSTRNSVDSGNENIDAQSIRQNVVRVLQYILSFLAIIGVSMMMYGGIIWIISAGADEKVGKARKIIIAAAIGLLIIVAAWVIVSFIINTYKNTLG